MSVAAFPTPNSVLDESFARVKAAYQANRSPSAVDRRRHLDRLRKAILDRQVDIADAINADFSSRSRHETLMTEIFMCADGCKYMAKHVKKWMQPQARHVSAHFLPGSAKVIYQPLGVVGVIAPWNYPVQLAVLPVAIALAAGNKVMLKPSEFTPRTSALLKEILDIALPGVVETVVGGVETGVAFSKLPFDHLFYTGSTAVGRKVMAAAAENLTPVTLELGGKSPAIVHSSFSMDRAANKILGGKVLNAGQTCIAPDYVLLPRGKEAAFEAGIHKAMAKMYPNLAGNNDYTAIVNEGHFARLSSYLDDALAKGARVVVLNPAGESFEGGRKLPPHLVFDVTDDMTLMQDEIFGPILPIVSYDTLDDAMAFVNDRPRPLALYYFDNDGRRVDTVLQETISGGATINDCILHVAQEDIPFGGVGPSGMGSYHGFEGFETMSHKRGVFMQSRFALTHLFHPPFGKTVERLVKLLTL
jgi:coniferyl-aldehyde dehydrogenase